MTCEVLVTWRLGRQTQQLQVQAKAQWMARQAGKACWCKLAARLLPCTHAAAPPRRQPRKQLLTSSPVVPAAVVVPVS